MPLFSRNTEIMWTKLKFIFLWIYPTRSSSIIAKKIWKTRSEDYNIGKIFYQDNRRNGMSWWQKKVTTYQWILPCIWSHGPQSSDQSILLSSWNFTVSFSHELFFSKDSSDSNSTLQDNFRCLLLFNKYFYINTTHCRELILDANITEFPSIVFFGHRVPINLKSLSKFVF